MQWYNKTVMMVVIVVCIQGHASYAPPLLRPKLHVLLRCGCVATLPEATLYLVGLHPHAVKDIKHRKNKTRTRKG